MNFVMDFGTRMHKMAEATLFEPFFQIMAIVEGFVSGDDLDTTFDRIDNDIFEKDAEFFNLISSNVSEVSLVCIASEVSSFSCLNIQLK